MVESIDEKGLKEKTLKGEDIPKLYLWAIILCYWREILMSGLFALLKVLTLLASPLLLNASLVVMVLTGLCNTPLAKLQHKFLTKLLVAQDERFIRWI